MKTLSYISMTLGTILMCCAGETLTAMAVCLTGMAFFGLGIYGLNKNQSK